MQQSPLIDRFINEFDRSLRALTGTVRLSRRIPTPPPPQGQPKHLQTKAKAKLSAKDKAHAAGLMRVNHVGEICAQALYQAQKLATRSARLKRIFERAAREEEDHLGWILQRLHALDSHPSLLNPLWYLGAFTIGLVAGKMGDRASLSFMVETERQVEQHLYTHLEQLPENDDLSRAIIEQMCVDEMAHAQVALDAGSVDLPKAVRLLMRGAASVMTKTAYYI